MFELVDSLFAAIARQVSVMGIAAYLAAFIVLVVYPSQVTTPPVIGTFLLFSVSLALITFGLFAYVATWSSRFLQIVVVGFCIGALFGLLRLWAWLGEYGGPAPIFILALLQVFVGLVFIRIARRKWLNLELG